MAARLQSGGSSAGKKSTTKSSGTTSKALPASLRYNDPGITKGGVGTGAPAITPQQFLAPPKATSPAPVSRVQNNTSGYMGAALGGGGTATANALASTAGTTTPVVDNSAQSDDDWLAGDSTYNAALAALKKTMSGYQADYDKSKTNYENDYNDSLKNLGWQSDGTWNQDDQNTAYGRSYGNQLNDYAARDMLQSSFYGTALQDLLRQFNDQKTDIDKSKSKYFDDLASTLGQQQNENDISQQQARAESIARKAAGVTAY